jgi:hypothetical protein
MTCIVSCSYTCSTLPVTLVSFEAEGGVNQVLLNWTVASEIGTYSYIIRRSTDPEGEFEVVAEVLSRVSTVNTTDYSHVDYNVSPGVRYYYTIADLNLTGGETLHNVIASATPEMPSDYFLVHNFPNPFNAVTTIVFNLPQSGDVSLNVFDIKGRLVSTLVGSWIEAGTHQVVFDANHLVSGIYVYQLATGNSLVTGKMVLLK